MDDYGGFSRAVREEIEHITARENLAKQIAKPKETQKDNSFWGKLRFNMSLLINKEPK